MPVASARRRRLQPHQVRMISLSVAATIVVLAVAAALVHNRLVSKPASCPTTSAVNALLGTHLGSLLSIREATIFTCTYNDAGGAPGVGIAVAARNATGSSVSSPPCTGRPALRVMGRSGCEMAGTRGTARGDPSILVNTVDRKKSQIAWQFTSYTPSITQAMLVKLAGTVVTPTPDPDV